VRAILLFRFGFVLAAFSVFAGPGVPIWTNRCIITGDDRARAVAVDANGNVFVTGETTSQFLNPDYATVAYSSAGTPLWTNRYHGPVSGDNYARAIATDNNGNVFVTGYSAGSSFAPYNHDYATIKYSGSGTPLWTNRYIGLNNGGTEHASAIALDASGNVFVTGSSTLSGSVPGSFYAEVATVAYANDGAQLWVSRHTEYDGTNFANAIAVDASGNIFVTGGAAPLGSVVFDYLTIAYDNNGNELWSRVYGAESNGVDIARAIAVDTSGNVIVTGQSYASGSGFDYATVKYAGDGTALWTNRYHGGVSNDYAVSIAVDLNSQIYVAGYVATATGNDYVTLAYSSAGAPLWTNRFHDATGSCRASAVKTDASGNVFVTGTASSVSGFVFITLAYSGSGTPLWTNRFRASSSISNPEEATALAVDNNGNVLVAGYAFHSQFPIGQDFVTLKYSGYMSLAYLSLQYLNNQLVLTWTNAGFNLQSAPKCTGTFTNIPGATSPYTNPIGAGQQFFRLISN
jgi:hypothetical protein